MKNLAIVIPAYKANYLAQTLESIASQTCQDFTLYIGDDASPNNLKDVVNSYKDQIDIVYKRFEQNVGGKDLVAQWERCIALTKGEPWIWLFSDDDIMYLDCVEAFYEELKKEPLYDLYRFNVDIINKDNDVIDYCKALHGVMSSEEIYFSKQEGKMNSFVVEYIFSSETYDRFNGFQNFDLAWNSDIATWMKFGREKGIKTISGSAVSWRSSGENITTREDKNFAKRKFKADMAFLKWVNKTFGKHKMRTFNYILRFKLTILYLIKIKFSICLI